MGRPTTVNRLPGNVREPLDSWLKDPAITQQEAPVVQHVSDRKGLSFETVAEIKQEMLGIPGSARNSAATA